MHLQGLFSRNAIRVASILLLFSAGPSNSNPSPEQKDAEVLDSLNSTLAAPLPPTLERRYEYGGWSTPAQWAPTTSWGPVTAPPSNGYWETWTQTEVMTNYVTKTYITSRFIPYTTGRKTTTKQVLHCGWGHEACGNICCPRGQYCHVEGWCARKGHKTFESYSAPLAVTSNGVVITVAGGKPKPKQTVPFQPAETTGHVKITTEESSGGLSGGAIAGIVIGVIIALIILIILCLFLCFRAAWDSLLAIFGLGRKRRRRETVEYESYHRHGSRSGHKSWYGEKQPGRPPPKEDSRLSGWGKVAAALGAFAVALGLKRRYDRKNEKSSYSSSYYSSDYSGGSE